MKLIAFQSLDVLKYLIDHGYLDCKPEHINGEKYGFVYDWVVKKCLSTLIILIRTITITRKV